MCHWQTLEIVDGAEDEGIDDSDAKKALSRGSTRSSNVTLAKVKVFSLLKRRYLITSIRARLCGGRSSSVTAFVPPEIRRS
jgi:hypothetical protein